MIRFFIDRPKFAIVLSLLMTIAGAIALKVMPVSLYPSIAPPTVNVFTQFRGANSQVVNDTVASVIEKQVNGVEGMIYMRSNSSNDGIYSLDVYFDIGFDADRAATLVQNRVNAAMPLLPETVKRGGVFVEKISPNILMIPVLVSPDNSRDALFLSNYANINIKERLARTAGVSKVELLGEKEYSMRIWANPERLAALDLTVPDLIDKIQENNEVRSAGTVGAEPSVGNNAWQYTVTVRGRLKNEEGFGNIRLRTNPDGTYVLMKDVARIELGAAQYLADAYVDNQASIAMAVYQSPSANALDVSAAVLEVLEEAKQRFPDGVDFQVPYDSTEFIDASIYSVYETLVIAIILVTFVTWAFLGSWRTTLIPAIAIPVSLIGTFAVLNALDITINTISLFGLVLAIGVVVDAAIVVIENVERLLHETDLSIRDAVIKSMAEVTGPCVASAAVLLAVFGPTLFMPGMTGIIYSQFGIAISVSVVISTIVALTLTPALCVLIMKREEITFGPLVKFHKLLDKTTDGFAGSARFLGKKSLFTLVLFGVLVGSIGVMFKSLPEGFLPDEDQGVVFAVLSLPDGAALNRTRTVSEELVDEILKDPAIKTVLTVPGYSLLDGATNSNTSLVIAKLHHWSERSEEGMSQFDVAVRVQDAINDLSEGVGFAFSPPAIPELGMVDGFEFVLLNERAAPPEEMEAVLQDLIAKANERPEIAAAFSSFSVGMPNIYLDINEERAALQGVRFDNLVDTINVLFGGTYINDYTLEGRNYMVMLQADQASRTSVDDLSKLYVRSSDGDTVRVSSLIEPSTVFSPVSLMRYNVNGAALINGITMPGFSGGDAIAAMEVIAEELPEGYSFEWTGLTLQQKQAGNAAIIAFLLAIVFTYLFLVAQYESWMTPWAILLCVPTALLGTLGISLLTEGDFNLYTQIALVLLVGMASRNAILIVEFAKVLRENDGLSVLDAAVQAVRMRIRAVLMTAFSFILGVVPLMFASSAGAGAQQTIGIASFGGMLAATFVGCLLVPAFFVMFQNMREKFGSKPQQLEHKPVDEGEAA